jgi:predicted transport protein
MPKMLIIDGIRFNLWTPDKEVEEFHPIVKELAKDIFGRDSVYLPIGLRLKSEAGLGAIPDGFVIDSVKKELYIVEVELSKHNPYKHINDQLTRFINSMDNSHTKRDVVEGLYTEIDGNKALEYFKEKINENLYRWLSKLLEQSPKIVVVIEEITPEVNEACKILMKSYDTKILEIQTYQREDAPTVRAYLFDTLSLNTSKAVVDSSRADAVVHVPKAEDAHFKGKEYLRPIYEKLKETMLSLGQDVKVGAPTQYYIPFARRVIFCGVHVKKKWLRLDLRKVKDIKHPKITPYPKGDWVYVHIEKNSDIDEILDVIKKAYERAV